MRLGHAIRRYARATADRPGQTIRVANATVATVTPGGAADGSTAITITVGADTLPAMYPDSYTPTVGDVVWVLLVDGAPRVLGRPTGPPNL